MRLLLFTFLFLNLFSTTAQTSQTTLEGNVSDSVTREAMIGASVKVTQNGALIKGTITDFNGRYRILLDPGVYDVEFLYTGYKVFSVKKITVVAAQVTRQSPLLSELEERIDCHFHIYWPFLVDKSPGNTGFLFTSEMLRHAY